MITGGPAIETEMLEYGEFELIPNQGVVSGIPAFPAGSVLS